LQGTLLPGRRRESPKRTRRTRNSTHKAQYRQDKCRRDDARGLCRNSIRLIPIQAAPPFPLPRVPIIDESMAGSCLGPAAREFTSSMSYSPLPGILIVRRTCPLVLTLTRAPIAPKEAARPFVVAVIRKGPIFRDVNARPGVSSYRRISPLPHHRRPSVGAPASADRR